MKRIHICVLSILFQLLAVGRLVAAEESGSSWDLQPHSLGRALLYMVIFAAAGIAVAITGYKVFDRFTPGDLHKEIVEKQNVAAAIVAGAVLLGICIIIAAAMIG